LKNLPKQIRFLSAEIVGSGPVVCDTQKYNYILLMAFPSPQMHSDLWGKDVPSLLSK